MPKLYIGNAFSLSMLDIAKGSWTAVRIWKLENIEDVKDTINMYVSQGYDVVSFVGHESTAKLMSKLLGMKIPANRIQVETDFVDDVMIVFQLLKRLPPATELSEEELKKIPHAWYLITGT